MYQQQHEQRQRDIDCRPDRPVLNCYELISNNAAHDGGIRPAQNIRDVKQGQRRQENHDTAGDYPRSTDRHNDFEKGGGHSRAQIFGGLQKASVQFFKRRVQRQDHKRQQRIGHTDKNGQICVKQFQRMGNQTAFKQKTVDDAVFP